MATELSYDAEKLNPLLHFEFCGLKLNARNVAKLKEQMQSFGNNAEFVAVANAREPKDPAG